MKIFSEGKMREGIATVGVVAGCVLEKDGKYLLVQEKKKKAYGLWNVPAGHVDEGETIEQAAMREVLEETGLQVKLKHKIHIYHESLQKAVRHIFYAEIVGGTLSFPEDEILDAQWLTFKDVEALQVTGKLRNPMVLDYIERVVKQKEGY